MRVSSIYIDITERDIFGIIQELLDEYIDVEGLSIDSFSIKENILVSGVFKKGITLKFNVELSILGVQDNCISLGIVKIRALGIPIAKSLVNGILKKVLKAFEKIGVGMKNGILAIDLNLLSPLIPFVDFKVKSLEVLDGSLNVEVVDLNYNSKKVALDFNEALGKENSVKQVKENVKAVEVEIIDKKENVIEVTEVKLIEEAKSFEEKTTSETQGNQDGSKSSKSSIHDEDMDEFEKAFRRKDYKKVRDGYTDVREVVANKLPEQCLEYKDIIFALPDLLALTYRLFREKRVSMKNKVIIGIMLGYSIAPIDIIPEKVKILGKLDDIVIFLIGLNRLLNNIDEEIILENWQGDEEIILMIKKGVSFGAEKMGGNVMKAVNLIDTFI